MSEKGSRGTACPERTWSGALSRLKRPRALAPCRSKRAAGYERRPRQPDRARPRDAMARTRMRATVPRSASRRPRPSARGSRPSRPLRCRRCGGGRARTGGGPTRAGGRTGGGVGPTACRRASARRGKAHARQRDSDPVASCENSRGSLGCTRPRGQPTQAGGAVPERYLGHGQAIAAIAGEPCRHGVWRINCCR